MSQLLTIHSKLFETKVVKLMVTDCETKAYTRFKIGKYKLFFSVWKEMCSSLFWVVTQCMLISDYWLFEADYWSHFQWSSSPRRMLLTGESVVI
jgi:hypothetical protein